MRHLLCRDCAKKKSPGTRLLYPASESEGPAEYERVLHGIARTPTANNRWIAINGVRVQLPLDSFVCDICNAPIKPGDSCATHCVRTQTSRPIEPWEHEYIQPGISPENLAP